MKPNEPAWFMDFLTSYSGNARTIGAYHKALRAQSPVLLDHAQAALVDVDWARVPEEEKTRALRFVHAPAPDSAPLPSRALGLALLEEAILSQLLGQIASEYALPAPLTRLEGRIVTKRAWGVSMGYADLALYISDTLILARPDGDVKALARALLNRWKPDAQEPCEDVTEFEEEGE